MEPNSPDHRQNTTAYETLKSEEASLLPLRPVDISKEPQNRDIETNGRVPKRVLQDGPGTSADDKRDLKRLCFRNPSPESPLASDMSFFLPQPISGIQTRHLNDLESKEHGAPEPFKYPKLSMSNAAQAGSVGTSLGLKDDDNHRYEYMSSLAPSELHRYVCCTSRASLQYPVLEWIQTVPFSLKEEAALTVDLSVSDCSFTLPPIVYAESQSAFDDLDRFMETRGKPGSGSISTTKHTSSPAPHVEYIGEDIVFDTVEPFDTRGHFCDLFLGRHRTAGKVALKRLRHRGGSDIEVVTRHFQREKDIWMGLQHDRILKCFGMFTRDRHLYLVSPFMRNGSLFDWIRLEGHVGVQRLRLIYELADALVYLHSSGIVHGDVKANNVLLSDDFHVQLCDFGLTKLAESNTTTTLKGAGSVRWQAPELWNNESKTFASDVYAFSMTIVEVLTGQAPFANIIHDAALIKAISMTGKRPARVPETSPDGISYAHTWNVAEQCWLEDPARRISMKKSSELLNFHIEPSVPSLLSTQLA